LAIASIYIQKGAKWIVTNDDSFTFQQGFRAPGNGCAANYLETCLKGSGGEGLICEKFMTGKPDRAIVDLIRG
jgi:ribonucleotide monophosphatase NagD (HAD superfamily)